MVRQIAIALALALGIPLAACQPAEQQQGGGAGLEQRSEQAMGGSAIAGDRFEAAYTNLAEVHMSLVQGDWEAASENMQEVRENLDAMKPADGQAMPAEVTNRIAALQRSALTLDQLIASRNPEAVTESRTLMNTFTRESTLAQVGQAGGGAGKTMPKNR